MFNFIGQVFHVLIGQPIFNLLVIIIAILPGHNLGVAIIIFTLLVRIALYPLLKKQLHHAMALKKLQPEMKKIKKQAKGDKALESKLMMELYKEKEVSPFGSIGIILAQLPILLALYLAITKIIKDPNSLVTQTYSWVQNLPYVESLANNIQNFDESLMGLVDLTRSATGPEGFYWPAMLLVIGSVVVQYYQSRQLMMTDKNTRSLRVLLKDTAAGKEVDQSEVQAATNKLTLYIIPFFLFIVAINLASALSLYWMVGGLIAIWQQSRILKKDVTEMEAEVDGEPVEAEVIESTNTTKKPKNKTKKSKKTKKRRK
jgi:YidC/Oxa1 family membrane protein insertase